MTKEWPNLETAWVDNGGAERLKAHQALSQAAVDLIHSVYSQATSEGKRTLDSARLHIDDTTEWEMPEPNLCKTKGQWWG